MELKYIHKFAFPATAYTKQCMDSLPLNIVQLQCLEKQQGVRTQ